MRRELPPLPAGFEPCHGVWGEAERAASFSLSAPSAPAAAGLVRFFSERWRQRRRPAFLFLCSANLSSSGRGGRGGIAETTRAAAFWRATNPGGERGGTR